jgi:predicted dehydrogenase
MPSWRVLWPRRGDEKENAMAKPLRWGIIGTGGIAHTFVRDLGLIDEGVALAVGSRTEASANAFADEFDIPRRYGSYEELVSDPDVDAVYVSTPHPMHHANTLLALNAGKPVLCEKPFTMNSAEARDLVAIAREKGLFKIRELVDSGALGDLVLVEADHGQWFPLDPEHRIFAPELGGGALLDLGVYPVSFASMLLGTPSRITALVDRAFTGVDGQTSMLFGYDSGAHAVLTCTSLARTATRACIAGTEARIEIAGDFYGLTSFDLIKRDRSVETFEFDMQWRGLRYQAIEVARCLDLGLTESPSMPLDESIAIMETMETVLTYL